MEAKITRDVLESHLACKYKCYLKLGGRQGRKSNYENWLVESRVQQRRDTIVNLLAYYQDSEVIRDTALDVPTLKNGTDVILDGTFSNNLLSLRFDGLIKVMGPSDLGQFHYVPILFHEGQARTRQRVLLELFALILLELQGRVPGTALIWRSTKPTTIRVAPALKTANSVMREIEQLQRSASVPMLFLNDHCQVCEFQETCYAEARSARSC
jgi:predicted RecB family nuclease